MEPKRAFFLISLGLVFSLFPYLGIGAWFADFDEIVAIQIAAKSFHNHLFYLSDGVHKIFTPSLYPWLQIIPATVLTKFLGLAPEQVGLVWRAFAGLSIPLCWYYFFIRVLKNQNWATLATVIAMTDGGYRGSGLVYRQAVYLWKTLSGDGSLFSSYPEIFLQWRLITPALSLPILLVHIARLYEAQNESSKKNIFYAGLSLGLLIYTYFYFWTAVCAALILGAVIYSEQRRIYLGTLLIGLTIGAPSLILGFIMKRAFLSDYLLRNDLFVPITHLSDILLPAKSLVLLVLSWVWILKVKPDRRYFGLLFLAAFLLLNHQVVTRLQIQNFHYTYVTDAMGFIFIFDYLSHTFSGARIKTLGRVCAALLIGSGLILRAHEVGRSAESMLLTLTYKQLVDEKRLSPNLIVPNTTIAGRIPYSDFLAITKNLRPLAGATVQLSPRISDPEWHEREALNGYLVGEDFAAYSLRQKGVSQNLVWGKQARTEAGKLEFFQARVRAYKEVVMRPLDYLEKFEIKYVVTLKGQTPPEIPRRSWAPLIHSSHWTLWELPN